MKRRIISKIIITAFILIFLYSSATYADGNLLKRGDDSESVAALQQILKDKGYFTYEEITGYYGKITEDAVKSFQADNGLRIDGIAGDETWAALLEEGGYEHYVSDEDNIYLIGMESTKIYQIQLRLKELGFYDYDYITGYFGSITQSAVSAFQGSCSLEVTGEVDTETWNKLFDDYSSVALLPGTAGDIVIPLQTRLFELGYYSFAIDGYYGSKTKDAVLYFQKASGITSSGIADSPTQELLFSEDAITEQEARRILTSIEASYEFSADHLVTGEQIAILAQEYLGYPYVYGGQGPDEFDCDGFVKYIYELAGYKLSDSSFAQFDGYGIKIYSREDLRPGDLVFFDTLLTDGNLADHAGIYLGDGYFIHADSSLSKRAVVIETMASENGWYGAWFSWGIRIVESE